MKNEALRASRAHDSPCGFEITLLTSFTNRHNPHSLHHKYRHNHRPFQLSCDTNLHPGSDFDNELRNNHHFACRNNYRNLDGSNFDPGGCHCDGNNCIDGSR
jgi:hypothetical protein